MQPEFPERQAAEEAEPAPQRATLAERARRWTQRGVHARFKLLLEMCGDLSGRSVLLCGHVLEDCLAALAYMRAGPVLVIADAADEAGRLTELIQAEGLAETYKVLHGDPLELTLGRGRYDLVIALAAFDNRPEPRPLLARLHSLCGGRLLASFVRRGALGSPLRRLHNAQRGPDALLLSRRELGLIACSLAPRRLRIEDFDGGGMLLALDVK